MVNEERAKEGLVTSSFKITGLCSCEGKIIEKKMKNLIGVKEYSLNPVTNNLKVTYDSSQLNIEGIQNAVSKAGGRATLMKPNQLL
jgi:copper chaperone CopZ